MSESLLPPETIAEIDATVADLDATVAEINASLRNRLTKDRAGLIADRDGLLVSRNELVALKFASALDAAGRPADADVMISRVNKARAQ
jgi:hypothetical protein